MIGLHVKDEEEEDEGEKEEINIDASIPAETE